MNDFWKAVDEHSKEGNIQETSKVTVSEPKKEKKEMKAEKTIRNWGEWLKTLAIKVLLISIIFVFVSLGLFLVAKTIGIVISIILFFTTVTFVTSN